MKANIYRLIEKNATWKKVGFFLILNITIQRILTLNFASEFKNLSGGFEAPDMKVAYGTAHASLAVTENQGGNLAGDLI
jgi:hypothetical protein